MSKTGPKQRPDRSLGFRALGFKAQGLGLRVSGLGLRVLGFRA